MGIHHVPEIYRESDMIYHYTSTETALLNILPDRKIRLSPRDKSNDPIENTGLFYSFSGEQSVPEAEYESIAYDIKEEVKSVMDRAKQLCLCKNHKIENEDSIRYLPFEKYGFAKPRMWDQYGDKYQGICLALSKRELIKVIDTENVIHRDISYINYSEFETQHQSIDLHELKTVGREDHQKKYFDFVRKRLFQKHEDYIGENEYRFCSFAEGSYDYIDINRALKGIVMTDLGLNRKLFYAMQDELSSFDNVHFSIMSFSKLGISIKDAKDHFKLIDSVTRQFDESNSK